MIPQVTDIPLQVEIIPPFPIPASQIWEWNQFIGEYPRAWYANKTPQQRGDQAYSDFTDMKRTKDTLFFERLR